MADHAPKIRRLTSDYLLPPLDTELHFAYRVTIAQVNGKPGVYTLTLDPNSCILDDFGRQLGCTLMADFEFEVALELLASGDDELLYDVTSRQSLPARFRLVFRGAEQPRECGARLLTLDDDGQIAQIIPLRAV
ncbi:MAG TPA: hypothetical protein VK034_25290 [Enhygromyxa sp.]|nr:hypothetical protein [Enhygromyxa sp.]